MPDKKQTLSDLRQLLESGEVNKDEVLGLFPKTREQKPARKFDIAEILYGVGGSIIFLGIIILVWQNWDQFTQAVKVLITLGSATSAYAMGFLFSTKKETVKLSPIFYLLSAALAPFGLHTLLDSQGINAATALSQSFIAGALLTLYLLSFIAKKRYMFAGISIIFATWLYLALGNHIMGAAPIAREYKLDEWRIIILGASYLALANYFKRIKRATFTSYLNFFGTNAVLLGALIMGGWKPNQSPIWEMLYPIIVSGFIFGSTRTGSNSMLGLGTIYLMIFILKITSQYFAGAIGWPLALVISGFLLMIIGLLSVRFKQKYLKNTPPS